MDYKDTLNLPKTDFSMRANLVKKEPQFLDYWKKIDLYNYTLEEREGKPLFVLHDGPPYANGHIHLGTAMNKILKDVVMKYKTMRGYKTPYIPGWDTHGLPIEHKVTTELGEKAKEMSASDIRKECEKFAKKFIEIQKKEFIRLGVRGDWESPYYTFDPMYEAKILEIFKTLIEKGQVYRAKKPIYWCHHCKTALAEAEIEYHDHESPSIYVKFPFEDEPEKFVIIWTTTPWTLPANTGVALHPHYTYVELKVGNETWIVAKDLLENFVKEANIENYEVIKEFKGAELDGKLLIHPIFDNKRSRIFLADFVSLDTGTGCVHTAPGHGEEDYIYGHLKNGLDVISPVDDEGRFTEEAGKYAGLRIEEANPIIIEDLRKKGILVAEGKITHSYPHCWRCKNPIIFRATPQWFISVEKNEFREKVLDSIEKVQWIPEWGKNRIKAMVEERPDWCISRQRMWGVPIPALKCEECGEEFIDEKVLGHFIELVRKEGTNAWFKLSEKELIPDGVKCPKCGSTHLKRTYNTFDVWIDSGSSFEAVVRSRDDHKFPVDMYLEGSDQHRGWFQSSLWLSVAQTGEPPYKTVLTHGFIKDEQGRAMSKSLGNVISPLEITEKYGADILRLWVMSVDYFNDVRMSFNIMNQQVEVYKKIRNTFRYMLGNIYDFYPDKDSVPFENMPFIDKWMMGRLQELIKRVTQAYEDYEFSKAYSALVKFITNELSSFYLDITKDRLYVEAKESFYRRSAQTVIFETLFALVKMFAPFLTFTTEEVYQHMANLPGKYKTIQVEMWPEYDESKIDESVVKEMEIVLAVREEVLKALEEARAKGVIGHSLDAQVALWSDKESVLEVIRNRGKELEEIFIVSKVIIEDNDGEMGEYVKVKVERAKGQKCQRCWKYSEDIGKD
ncbi:MAG: isoleucine--tRNA ligase, partial [Thermotogaceae bacterium]|nr:isoleucine--tRNA ligase [Thermotogaceae bacterium]